MPESLSIPVLSVGRRVTNIAPEHMEALEYGLVEELDGSLTQAAVRGLLHPQRWLRAPIIPRYEFAHLQRLLGSNMLAAQDVQDLAECLEDELTGVIETRDVETLPTHLNRRGSGSRFTLTIGESMEVVRERVLAKQIIADFIGQDLPRGMWRAKDEKITQISLANSETAEEANLLPRLGSVIEKAVAPAERSFPSVLILADVGVQTTDKELGGSGQV